MDIETFVIGAIARDLIFEYVYDRKIRRATEDVDFGVAVENWKQYEYLKASLAKTRSFKFDQKIEQRMWWKSEHGEMKIDLIPFGGVETEQGEIAFPPNGDFEMNIAGFAEVYQDSIEIELSDGFKVKIASLSGLALLKFIAFNDRPHVRRRDIQDIWFIARNYMEADNEYRLYDKTQDGDLLTDDFDYELCGARLLGRDIAKMLNDKTQKIVVKLLSEETDGGRLIKLADIINSEGLKDEDRYDNIMRTFCELRTGITEMTGHLR